MFTQQNLCKTKDWTLINWNSTCIFYVCCRVFMNMETCLLKHGEPSQRMTSLTWRPTTPKEYAYCRFSVVTSFQNFPMFHFLDLLTLVASTGVFQRCLLLPPSQDEIRPFLQHASGELGLTDDWRTNLHAQLLTPDPSWVFANCQVSKFQCTSHCNSGFRISFHFLRQICFLIFLACTLVINMPFSLDTPERTTLAYLI